MASKQRPVTIPVLTAVNAEGGNISTSSYESRSNCVTIYIYTRQLYFGCDHTHANILKHLYKQKYLRHLNERRANSENH